jgi:hypothetical protein
MLTKEIYSEKEYAAWHEKLTVNVGGNSLLAL